MFWTLAPYCGYLTIQRHFLPFSGALQQVVCAVPPWPCTGALVHCHGVCKNKSVWAASCLNWETMRLLGWQDGPLTYPKSLVETAFVSPAFVRHEVFVQESISGASSVIVKDFFVIVAERCFWVLLDGWK